MLDRVNEQKDLNLTKMNGFWRKAIHIRAEWICLSGKQSKLDRIDPF